MSLSSLLLRCMSLQVALFGSASFGTEGSSSLQSGLRQAARGRVYEFTP